ncbi:BtpA/SgcQ family protein [Thermoanaerobacterium sp. DL9XJH110]|uniref:BtpA/SgcQ family protein n=1 Tax=Thermoanaerobacterium sp. DL9XJH110 TaxID=3386643 RepID=UPI003BB7BF64
MKNFHDLFPQRKVVIGMVHLKPLPGSAGFDGNLRQVYESALKDLKALEAGGAHGAIIENFSDLPYTAENPLETLLSMTAIVAELKREASIPLGVNFQFNCAREEMAISYVCGAEFIRVEAFVESRIGPFGVTFAQAPQLMRYRAKLKAETLVFADINVKHTYPLAAQDFSMDLKEAVSAGANAIIITGAETGRNPSAEDVRSAKNQIPDVPLLVGSGVTVENAGELMEYADGVIVGSYIKEDGIVKRPVDPARVRMLVEEINKIW